MNQVFTHARDIHCYLSSKRLIYSIPLYFEAEKNYFKSQFLEIEISPGHKKEFVLEHGILKSYILQPGVKPLTQQEKYDSCCYRK